MKNHKPRPPYLLSIDQGTSGSTVILVDANGEIITRGYRELSQRYPRPGWVEHDAIEIWQSVRQTVEETLKPSGFADDVMAIAIANQRETVVLWDRDTGRPIHPAIVWQCRRTAPICENLRTEGLEALVHKRTGLVLDPYFSASKIAWILDNVVGARERAERGNLAFGNVDAWLLWNLTGGKVHATDYTNASRTMLFNIDTLEWSDDLLRIFRVPRSVLPEVRPSGSVFGTTTNLDFALDGIPIAAIAGDQQAALFGQLCTGPEIAKNTYGTGCFMMLHTAEKRVSSKSGLLTTLACSLDESPLYALEGSVFIAGAAVQWLRDGIGIIKSSTETEAIAASVEETGGVTLVPAFSGLGAPYWNTNARGAILGLTRGTTVAHIVRATLESIAFQTADVVTAMTTDAKITLNRLRADGGAAANNILMQFQADILGIDVERPMEIETTGLGVAYLAGLTTNLWESVEALHSTRKVDRVFKPGINELERRAKLACWKDAVRRIMA